MVGDRDTLAANLTAGPFWYPTANDAEVSAAARCICRRGAAGAAPATRDRPLERGRGSPATAVASGTAVAGRPSRLVPCVPPPAGCASWLSHCGRRMDDHPTNSRPRATWSAQVWDFPAFLTLADPFLYSSWPRASVSLFIVRGRRGTGVHPVAAARVQNEMQANVELCDDCAFTASPRPLSGCARAANADDEWRTS